MNADLDAKRPSPQPGYQLEMLDDELLLFHPSSRTIIHSNDSGALIWQLCDGQRTVAQIIQLLQDAYPQETTIDQDVYHTLTLFAQHGAIAWS